MKVVKRIIVYKNKRRMRESTSRTIDRVSSDSRRRSLSNQRASSRQFDIVVYGATGFTGKFVAKRILASIVAQQNITPASDDAILSWAIAGRDKVKLEGVLKWLAVPEGINPPAILVADVNDYDSLGKAIGSARGNKSTLKNKQLNNIILLLHCSCAELCGTISLLWVTHLSFYLLCQSQLFTFS